MGPLDQWTLGGIHFVGYPMLATWVRGLYSGPVRVISASQGVKRLIAEAGMGAATTVTYAIDRFPPRRNDGGSRSRPP